MNRPVDFASLLDQIEAFKPLKRVAQDLGVSRAHLVNLKNGVRKEPGYTLGVRIVEYHKATIQGKFDHLKAKIRNGWQI